MDSEKGNRKVSGLSGDIVNVVPYQILQKMRHQKNAIRAIFCSLLLVFYVAVSARTVFAQVNVTAHASTTVFCGDGIKNGGEQCDGIDLGGANCASRGFSGGTLRCNPNCIFDTSQCIYAPPPSVVSGGGGGGSIYVTAAVNFSGWAYPLSKVNLLKDGQLVVSTISGPDAKFSISLTNLSTGNYVFSIYGEDNKGNNSALFTIPLYITQGATTNIGGIFLVPTIAIDKAEVKRGDNITIFGQSSPKSDITISINSDDGIFVETKSDDSGAYLYNLDTAFLEIGQHFIKAKAIFANLISPFSKTVEFKVGTKTVFTEVKKVLKGDLNGDNRVNLIDFSIAAYWYKKPNPPANIDLDGDGMVDLKDFSIMAYYWTG